MRPFQSPAHAVDQARTEAEGNETARPEPAEPAVPSLGRRGFFERGAKAVALGAVAALLTEDAAAAQAGTGVGYGPLVPDPQGLLDLPEGFTYTVLSRASADTLDSGHPMPDAHDGMAAFAIGGGTVLVRNHENSVGQLPAVPHLAGITFDDHPSATGGTVNVVLDGQHRPVSQYASLAGAVRNCAGGPTPWGTWLTCEETEQVLGQRHGYVFEVDPAGLGAPTPLVAMGRFAHEAVAVDPATGIVYETEDAAGPFGRVYRFLPADTSGQKGSLAAGGALEAMRAPGVADLAEVTEPGTTISGIEWQPCPVVDPPPGGTTVRAAVAASSTAIEKCEGIWHGNGAVYFVSSRGSTNQGQVWRYSPTNQTLTLVALFTASDPFDGPDNITVSPVAGEVFLVEDGGGEQLVAGLSPDGQPFAFARNALNGSELAGVCFAADNRSMFVNIYRPGHTFAVTGLFRTEPPVEIAEAPLPLALPVAAAAVVGGLIALRHRPRRGGSPASAATT